MGRRAGFHANKASRQRLEELQHLAAPPLLANDDLLGCVDRMNLKHVLGDIQTDCCNLHWAAPWCDSLTTITLMGPRCRERAPSITSQSGGPATLPPHWASAFATLSRVPQVRCANVLGRKAVGSFVASLEEHSIRTDGIPVRMPLLASA
jgi:hypothetical protein